VTLDPKDAAVLIRQTRSENTVLVGGQAVAFWIDYFGIPPRLAALTEDIDYLGTRREAKLANARLEFPHKFKVGTPEDLPNTALLSVNMEGYEAPILIDYLSAVIGVDSREIARSAVTIDVDGEALKVIHPIQLMKSKLWNLYRLRAKRTAEGIEQARLAIEIVAAFLKKAELNQRQTLKVIEAIGKFAATHPARYGREHYNLECLKAIPTEILEANSLPAAFREKRWPQIVAAAG
jgi:hypothetical protein